jgi:integrase
VLTGQSTAGMTVAALVDAYIADPERAALRSKKEIERRLRKNVVPVIGTVKLTELRRRDVRNVTDAILRRGRQVEATRVFGDVRAAVRWAVQNEYLDANPLEGMSKPAEPAPRTRVLSDGEIRTLWTGLPEALARSVQCQRIIKLCLVTGQRVGEVAGIVPAELDLNAREWRLPANRTKNAHPHVVPLSDLAIEIIEEATVGKGPLFPCGDGSPLPGVVARAVLRANQHGRFGIAPWSAHDLRRTALDSLAKLGVTPHVIAHVANHRSVTKGGVTFAHYVQHSYEGEKRAALDLWADRLTGIISGGAEVVKLGRRGR